MPFDPSATRSGSVFSSNPGYAPTWVCFINGIFVPILGFETSCGVWQIPSFRIHCFPDVSIQRLGYEDRVPVQIFCLDEWASDTPTWRLLVDGEIVGWSFSSANGTRSIAFSCLAHIHVFQQLYFFYMTNVDDIVASRSPEVLAQGFTTPGLLYPHGLFHQGLLSTAAQAVEMSTEDQRAQSAASKAPGEEESESTAPIQAPYELVTNVIKGVISSLVPNERRAIPMMNFFARHIRKTRFHNRWVRLPIFEDAETLSDRKGVFPIFNAARNDQALLAMQRQVVSQVGSSGPVWNLFQQVLGLVYMDLVMIPNPACVQVKLEPAGPNQPEEGRILRLFEDSAPLVVRRRGVNEAQARTRARRLSAELQRQLDAREAPDTALLQEAGLTSTPTRASEISEEQIYQTLVRQARTVAARDGNTDRATIDPREPIRLAQYAVKPQFLFGEVPACNVIMPSMVDSWTYDESFINQPTRVYINDSVMTRLLRAQGANREFMLHALTVGFPEEADALMHHRVASSASEGEGAAAGATESGRNLLIGPEEFFKGPVTARAALPSWFQMLRQFANSGGKGLNKEDTPNAPNAPHATPPNSVPVTTSAVEVPRSTTYTNAGPAGGVDSTQPTYASRVQVGSMTRVSLNGSQAPRFFLRNGGGLDPAHYIQATQTALWPLPVRQRNGRRGRASEAGGETRTTPQKMAQMVRLLLPVCRTAFPGLTEDQLLAVTFGIYWISFNEQGVNGYVSWALGNGKQYASYDARPWTINPWDRQPYQAARSPQDAAVRLVHDLKERYAASMNVLLTGRGDAAFTAFIQRTGYRQTFWESMRPIRPDLLYAHLGFIGYYASENIRDPAARAEIGLARSRSQSRYFSQIRTLLQQDRVPADEITQRPFAGAVYRPLMREEDRPFLAQERPAGRTTVTRNVARTAASNSNEAPTPGQGGAEEGDQFASLFRLYAQYEYLKQRYAQRNAGGNLRFNPYLVPGFPAMLFDSMQTRMHCVGYLQALSHSGYLTQGGASMSTTVQLSFCRTIHEFINDVRNDANRFAGRVTSAPAEIIDEIRTVIQDEARAEEFYQRYFYGGARPGRVPAVFRWERAMGYARGLGVEEIEITGDSVETVLNRQQTAAEAQRAEANQEETAGAENTQPRPASAETSASVDGVSSERQQTVHHNLDPNEELAPNPGTVYADAFDNYHIAMQLAARPVCTLEQFIRFWHGGRTINDLIESGEVADPRDDFAYHRESVRDVVGMRTDGSEVRTQTSRPTARFYGRIFRLRPGPGETPTEAQRGYTAPPGVQPSATSEGLPADYPETRADWDAVLLAYADRVLRLLSPST